jgi:hypothetical protein
MSVETKTTEVPKKMTALALFMDRVASLTPLTRSEVEKFSCYLKVRKDMMAWKDAEIIAAIPEWTEKEHKRAFVAFCKECIVRETGTETKANDILSRYKEWTRFNAGEKIMQKKDILLRLTEVYGKPVDAFGKTFSGFRLIYDDEDPNSEAAATPITIVTAAPAPSTSSVVEMLELQFNQTKKKLDVAKAELDKAKSEASLMLDREKEARAKARAATKAAEDACLMTEKVQTTVYELETEVAAKKVEFEKAANSSTSASSVTAAAPSPEEDAAEPLHVRRKKIPSSIRTLVWNKYIGEDVAQADCFCCRTAKISVRSFDCGHVIAEAKGGDLTINNLRPICKDCNKSMGTRSMNEFTKEYFGWTV